MRAGQDAVDGSFTLMTILRGLCSGGIDQGWNIEGIQE